MYALRQIEAVYSWHHDIGNNNIESIPIKLLKRLIAITGLFHLNSHQLEVDCKCLEIKRVVLDEQNSGHTGKAPQSTGRSTRREWLSNCRTTVHCWEIVTRACLKSANETPKAKLPGARSQDKATVLQKWSHPLVSR